MITLISLIIESQIIGMMILREDYLITLISLIIESLIIGMMI